MFSISLFTAVAGAAFGVALLWVMLQWLKVDQATTVAEQDVRKSIARLQEQTRAMQAASEQPTNHAMMSLDRYGEPFPATSGTKPETDEVEATAVSEEEAAKQARPLSQDETELSRLLFGWGASGMVFGLVFGAVTGGAPGATAGGLIGSTLGVFLVVVAALALDRIGGRKSKSAEKK